MSSSYIPSEVIVRPSVIISKAVAEDLQKKAGDEEERELAEIVERQLNATNKQTQAGTASKVE